VEDIQQTLSKHFGFAEFRPGQPPPGPPVPVAENKRCAGIRAEPR
jgi:hypothetical protein